MPIVIRLHRRDYQERKLSHVAECKPVTCIPAGKDAIPSLNKEAGCRDTHILAPLLVSDIISITVVFMMSRAATEGFDT